MGTLNSVIGNTRVNTLRLGWTQEDVAFANPCYNGNGRDQAGLSRPTLAYQTFTRSADRNWRQARVNDAYQIEDTFSWFVPGKWHGDHDLKAGVQYQVHRAWRTSPTTI